MEVIGHKFQSRNAGLQKNVGKAERATSLAAGALLLQRGLRNKGWSGTLAALLGVAFLRRAITGFSYTYHYLGIDSTGEQPAGRQGANVSVAHRTGVRVDEAITINRPREEVYQFWRDFSNIAQFMEHVESVRMMADARQSHWIAKGPAGTSIEWDAELVNEKENELIAWRSLDGAKVANAGSVHFADAAGGRGTEVRVEMLYTPPLGTLGSFITKLFGEDPATQIRSDLKRLKAHLESGVVPDTEGQPSGPKFAGHATPGQTNGHPHPDVVTKASEESFPASDAPGYTH
jgi:uncharacterized membrane protein